MQPVFETMREQQYGERWRGRSVLGTRADIAALTPAAALRWHALSHVPANAFLLVTGPVEPDAVAPMVRRHFAELEPGKARHPLSLTPIRPQRTIEQVEIEALTEPQLIYLKRAALPGIGLLDLAVRFDLLQSILNSTLEGSLAEPLRFDAFLASHYDLAFDVIAPGEFEFIGKPDRGVALPELLDALEANLQRLAQSGTPDTTFERVQQRRLRRLERDADDFDWQVNLTLAALGERREPPSTADYRQRLQQLTPDDLAVVLDALDGPGSLSATLASPASPGPASPGP